MDVAAFYYLEGGLLFGFLVAAGLTLVSLNQPNYRVARRCAWACAILFGSIAVVWGLTTMESAWIRISAVGIAGMVAAICLTEALRFIREREFSSTKVTEAVAPAPHGPTLEATNRSKIDASGAVIPGDLPFQFGKADNDSIIDMPGTVVTRQPDGSLRVSHGANPVDRKFPPPTGEFSNLTSEELVAKLLQSSGELRTYDKERSSGFKEISNKYTPFDPTAKSDSMDSDWRAVTEKFRSRDERLAKLAQSLASECMARIEPISGSSIPPAAQLGVIVTLHAKFAGPHPALAAANFLEFLATKLH